MDTTIQLQGDSSRPSSKTPLILVHAASGVCVPYMRLLPLSDDNSRPVYGVSSPIFAHAFDDTPESQWPVLPRTFGEEATQILELVRRSIPEVENADGWLLGGWSVGGYIALEMARQLVRQGEEVHHIVMLDTPAPRTFRVMLDRPGMVDEMAKITFDNSMAGLGLKANRDGDRLRKMMWQHIRNTYEMVDKEMQIYSEGAGASERFMGPVTLFRCTEATESREFGLEVGNELNWTTKELPDLETIQIPANHFTILSGEHVVEVSKIIRERLENVD